MKLSKMRQEKETAVKNSVLRNNGSCTHGVFFSNQCVEERTTIRHPTLTNTSNMPTGKTTSHFLEGFRGFSHKYFNLKVARYCKIPIVNVFRNLQIEKLPLAMCPF